MALSGYRRGWLKQPPDGVGPSQGEIGRDLLTLIHGGSPAVDLVSGGILSQAGGVIPLEATQFGTAYTNSGSALSAINAGPNVDGKELTFLALARPSSTSATTVAIGGYGKSTDAATLGFIGHGPSGGLLRFWMRNDAATVSQDLTASGASAGWSNGAWSVVIGRRSESGNVRSLWCNGVELTSTTCAALGTWTPDRTAIFGSRRTTDALIWNGSLALFAAWGRSLSDNEARALSQNPWQLFQPRRIWVPVSASASLALSASPLSIAGTVSASGDLAYETALALSASPLSLSGTLSTTGDLTITPAATLALSASPLAITGTLAPTGDLAYELPTLAMSASPLALSGTLTPSGEIDYQLPFALTASALAVSGTLSVSGDLSITDEIRLTLSASPLAMAGALAVAGDLDYVVPTLVLSASPLALSGAVAVTGDPAAVVPFVLSASPITLTGAVDVTGEIGLGTRFDITADPIVVSGALGVSGEILASFTVAQPLSAPPTGRRVQTGGRMNVQTTRRPTYRGGTR